MQLEPGGRWDVEAVSGCLPRQGWLRVLARGGWLRQVGVGAQAGQDCSSQQEGRQIRKARLEKSEVFRSDAALGKPAGFAPEMGKLRERRRGGGSHRGRGGTEVLCGALHGNCQSQGREGWEED